jgi:hypothetical protein
MPGLLFKGIKYVMLSNDNDFKKKSFYDNVYFTLRDIFLNAESYDDVMSANLYNNELTGGVYFEDRTESFEYANLLDQKDFVERLQKSLNNLKKNEWFEFVHLEDDQTFDDEQNYMKLDDWWVQFEELKRLVEEQYKKCCKKEE